MAEGPQENPDAFGGLMQLITGMWASQSVATMARLGVTDAMDGPTSAAVIAEKVGARPELLGRMMHTLSTIGVFGQPEPGVFTLTPMSELLRADHPASLRAMAITQNDPGHYIGWSKATEVVKDGGNGSVRAHGKEAWAYFGDHPEEADVFNQAMTALSHASIPPLRGAYPWSRHRRIVDVGGGHGALLSAILEEAPDASGVLFDQPVVIDAAATSLPSLPASERIEPQPGSFFEAVPSGADAYVMKHILHDWSDAKCGEILANVRRAIADDGRLLVVEMVMGPSAPPFAPWLDLNMMVLLEGKERSREQFAALFAANGFELVDVHASGGMHCVVEGKPI